MAEIARDTLPSGFDEQFLNEVEGKLICSICHLTLKEPVLTRCGHRFCKGCLDEHFRRQEIEGRTLTCPADRDALDKERDVFPDKATEREILSFFIKCSSDECEWTGELRDKEVHMESCRFRFVSCTNEKCQLKVRRKDLEMHLAFACQWRIINCEHCGEPHPNDNMQAHFEQCRKFSVSCPNSCGESFPREMIENHIKDECPLTELPCPYAQIGCENKAQRRNLDGHLKDTSTHLDLACAKLRDNEVKLVDTQSQLHKTQLKLNIMENKLTEAVNKLNYTEVELKETKETTIKLLEKLETLKLQFDGKAMKAQEQAETGQKGKFLWKVSNFSERLWEARTGVNERIASSPFHAGAFGYRLKAKMNPNGFKDGKNTHLSVYVAVMKGEYDAILSWPFQKKIKFTLIDQQEDPEKRMNVTARSTPRQPNPGHFSRPVSDENRTWGFHKFITHEVLFSRQYLVDDTLFLQVEVGGD